MDIDLASQVEARQIFDVLLKGKHFDRELAQAGIAGLAEPSRAALREQIIAALPGLQGDEHVWTRSWLLSSLGRVAGEDPRALDVIRERVSDPDEAEWARYWALEGAVAGSVANLAELGKIAKAVPEELPKYLGMAIVATTGPDDTARQELTAALDAKDNPDRQWLALRALRVMPVAGTERAVVAILSEDTYSSVNYQAVVSLGAVPPDSGQAVETAALALQRLVVDKRNDLMWSEARARAINGLARLRFPASAPTLVEELLDGNPAIVREAAIALETVLGADRAVDRVVEAAASTQSGQIASYAQALRWMDRKPVAERLEQILVAGQGNAAAVARILLTELGGAVAFQKLRARARSMEHYAEVLDKAEASVRQQFADSVEDARHGYKIATRMDIAVFVLGLGLLLASAVVALVNEMSLATWVSGGTGVLAVLYSLFVAKPRRRVEEAVDHLMYLKVIFLGYLRQLHQTDQAFTRRMLDDQPMTTADLEAFTELVRASKLDAITNLRSIERAAETTEGTALGNASSGAESAGSQEPAVADAPNAAVT